MKLSIYLMRKSVKTFNEILQTKQLQGVAAFKKPPATAKLPFPCQAYIQVNKKSKPKWAGFLEGHFELKGLRLHNQTNSFVLLVKKRGRFFAVTFGHGFQAVDPAKIEPRFGLMVAANCLKELRGLESNLIDRLTSNKKLHVGRGSKFSEFGLNPQVDWIRRLNGQPPTDNVAKSITGSDSCCIGVDCDLESIGAKCTELLDLFESDGYKAGFEFLDQLRPVSKHDPHLPALEIQLVKRLEGRSYERVSIAFPEMPNEEALDHYKVSCGVSMDMQELTLEGIYEFLDEKSLAADPGKIYVVGIGDNDAAVTRRRTLRDYLACEFDEGNDTFLFCNGEWFRAEKSYVTKVRRAVAAIQDATTTLALPPVRNGESEGDYNARVASVNNWLLMDKANFRIGGSYDKIEVCDLLAEEASMICVKKMEESSSLSHLFSQGSVSATLLRSEPKYRDNLNKAAKAEWPKFKPLDERRIGEATIVFGIATRKKEPLAEGMFFFSLINLLNHVRTIQLTGCQVALCKIGYEDAPSSPSVSLRKPRKRKSATAKAAR